VRGKRVERLTVSIFVSAISSYFGEVKRGGGGVPIIMWWGESVLREEGNRRKCFSGIGLGICWLERVSYFCNGCFV